MSCYISRFAFSGSSLFTSPYKETKKLICCHFHIFFIQHQGQRERILYLLENFGIRVNGWDVPCGAEIREL